MPLVVVCGYPCSGKTTLSSLLQKKLQQLLVQDGLQHSVELINAELLELPSRQLVYATSQEEKKARAKFMAAVQRQMNKPYTVVIADSMNYTKSERYQLYCVARELQTTHCVVHVGTDISDCAKFNSERLESAQKLTESLFQEMCNRFETPKPLQRWDNPLFTVMNENDIDAYGQAIHEALMKRQPMKANGATATTLPSSADYLYQLDKCCQSVISDVMARQKTSNFCGYKTQALTVELRETIEQIVDENEDNISMAQLSRIKRQFISMQQKLRYSSRHQEMLTPEKMARQFIDFVKTNLQCVS